MSTYSDLVLATTGLRAYWRLNEAGGALVDSKSAHNGTLSGSASYNQEGALRSDPDGCLLLSGGYVSVGHHADFNLGDSFSLELWFRRAVLGGEQVFINKGVFAYSLKLNSGGQPVLGRYGVANICRGIQAITDLTMWHYLVATKDGADYHVYMDGTDETVNIGNSTCADSSTALILGASDAVPNYVLRAYLDEVAIYAGALSDATVQEHNHAGRSQRGMEQQVFGMGVY